MKVKLKISYSSKGEAHELSAEAFLVATGRKANVEGLNLEAAGIETSERGFINVMSICRQISHISLQWEI